MRTEFFPNVGSWSNASFTQRRNYALVSVMEGAENGRLFSSADVLMPGFIAHVLLYGILPEISGATIDSGIKCFKITVQ